MVYTTPPAWNSSDTPLSTTNLNILSDDISYLAANPRENLLVNPGFEIWQRGNGAFTADLAWTADRWYMDEAGTDAFSVTKDTTNEDTNSVACMACDFTLGNGAGASAIKQLLEDFTQLRGKALSLSVRVKATVASAVRLSIYDSVTGWTYGSYHTGGGSYETLTVTATVAAAAASLAVGIFFAATCSGADSAYLDNAMLVVGSVAATYTPLHPVDEWLRCARYYRTWVVPASNTCQIGLGSAVSTTVAVFSLPLSPAMATAPSLVATAGDWTVVDGAGGVVDLSSISLSHAQATGVVVNATVASGLTQFRPYLLTADAGGTRTLALEANP